MFIEALSALAIDSRDVSLQEYQKVITKQSTYKIEKIKDDFLNLSSEIRAKMSNDLSILIDEYKKFVPINEETFINNFDKWEIVESTNILLLVNTLLDESRKLNKEYLTLKKLTKRYTSISSKFDELISLNNDIINFTNQYLPRAKEADEASKFMNNFISNNQEVLEALA